MRKECCILSSPKYSLAFSLKKVKRLQSISMSSLKKELSQKSPVLTGLLQGECGPNGSKWKSSFVVMAAAIHLKAKNQRLCLLQSLIGGIYYTVDMHQKLLVLN